MNYRLSYLLDDVKLSIETLILLPVIIVSSIERFFEWLGKIADEAVWAHKNYEKLEFELQEAKNDAWAANLVLADARCDLRKQLIKRCRQNQEYCLLRFINEGKNRALFWLKWYNRWIELENFYKELETEDR